MASKKKLLTSAIALGTAVALALGGTFAWQSISQEALNESADVVNPGGRLHNDLHYTSFNETDNNIYVENFTDPEKGGEDIFARVRLAEYFEVVLNYGTVATSTRSLIGSKETTDEGTTYTYRNLIITQDDDGNIRAGVVGEGDDQQTYWTLTPGTDKSAAVYMPTFNKNKDSLEVDVNGQYSDRVGGISVRDEGQYENYENWVAGDKKTANAIYDIDGNTADELAHLSVEQLNALIDNKGDVPSTAGLERNIQLKTEEHTAKAVNATKGLISMADWMALNNGVYSDETHGDYWVYDTDGWVYWSSPIAAGQTTGLLLDSFSLAQVMDNTWYYALEVEAQFVTADDVGKGDGTGFYEDADDQPTKNAERLLENIGVSTGSGVVTFSLLSEDGVLDNVVTSMDGDTAVYAYNGSVKEINLCPTMAVTADEEEEEGIALLSATTTPDGWQLTPSVDESLYTMTESDGVYTISTAEGGTTVATFDASTGDLTVEEDQNLMGLEVKAWRKGYSGTTRLYMTNGTEIWMTFSETGTTVVNENTLPLYDMVIFTAASEMSDSAKAAFAAMDEEKLTYSYRYVYTGSYPEWSSAYGYSNAPKAGTKTKAVRFTNLVKPTNMSSWFYGMGTAIEQPTVFDWTNLDTSEVEIGSQIFSECWYVTELDLSSWDTSNMTRVFGMFKEMKNLEKLTVGEKWDMSKATGMSWMFYLCKKLTFDCSDWDVSNVTKYTDFNKNASNVTPPNWNTAT